MLYLIKLNIILAILCLLFQVLMHRDTFFGVRRAMLIGIYMVALMLPLCDVQSLLSGRAVAEGMAADYATYILPTIEVTASRVASMGLAGQQADACSTSWMPYVLWFWILLFALPSLWLFGKMLWQIGYISYLRFTCARTTVLGHSVSVYPKPCSPFSFGRCVFLSQDSMADETKLHEVMTHELTHVSQWHTLDILLSQLFCIAFWWNPATWVMRREVRLNLEFIADKAVCNALTPLPNRGGVGGEASRLRAYQYHLLGFASQLNVATLTNNFNVLPLKRRIIMMNAKRTRYTGMLKYILFVPVAAAIVLFCNIDAMARNIAAEMKPLVSSANTALVQNAALTIETPLVPERGVGGEDRHVAETPKATTDDDKQNEKPNLIKLEGEPLVIINDKEASIEEYKQLKPEDIESVNVLKDKAATDLWGSKGANGVIEIKTKAHSDFDYPTDCEVYILDGKQVDESEVKKLRRIDVTNVRMLDLNEAKKYGVEHAVSITTRHSAVQGAVYEMVEEMPEYPGGLEALYQYVATHVKYPALAHEVGAQGKVLVQFVVTSDGQITDVKTAKLLSTDGLSEITVIATKEGMSEEEIKSVEAQNAALEQLKAESIRVVKTMPRWKPGKHAGKPVNVRFTLPITFRLQ